MSYKSFSQLLIFLSIIGSSTVFSQDLSKGEIHGNFEANAQTSKEDNAIGSKNVPEKFLMNAFSNINYTNGNFSAGIRFESYLNPMLGFNPKYAGSGLTYKYATYKISELEITVGNYYEQFGNGLIFRSYEERGLGIDNAMNGLRLKYNPYKGIIIKGIIGRQRYFFSEGEGIIRGMDGEININELLGKNEAKTKLTLGGSFISKFQADNDPDYKLPQNVFSYSGRMNLSRGKFALLSEYAYKYNDPSAINNYIYKPGQALLVTSTFSQKGLGISLSGKRIDNMGFFSDRAQVAESGNPLSVNYLPALTRQHAYTLSAMYPYASQPNGEMGLQADVMYKFHKGTTLGGKYGTSIALNYSTAKAIEKTAVSDKIKIDSTGTLGYNSDFFAIGKDKFFEDFNVEIKKKVSSKFSFGLSYLNQIYNKRVIQNENESTVYAQIVVLDMTYKVKPTQAIRLEMQHLNTKQDFKNWAMGLVEYTVAPNWFFTLMDSYNYGDTKVHYVNGAIGFSKNSNRFQVGYGKQKRGIVCVGGVCREVPASNGFTLSITSSF